MEVSQVHGVSLPCLLRVSVSAGIFCLTNLFAEVQARMYNASLARGKKRKADEP